MHYIPCFLWGNLRSMNGGHTEILLKESEGGLVTSIVVCPVSVLGISHLCDDLLMLGVLFD